VVPPFWIVSVRVGVVLPLIVVDVISLLILLKGKIIANLTIVILMTLSTKITR